MERFFSKMMYIRRSRFMPKLESQDMAMGIFKGEYSLRNSNNNIESILSKQFSFEISRGNHNERILLINL